MVKINTRMRFKVNLLRVVHFLRNVIALTVHFLLQFTQTKSYSAFLQVIAPKGTEGFSALSKLFL